MGNCFCMKVRKESNRGISVADQPAINLSTFFHHYTRSTCSTTRNKDIRRGTFAALLWLESGRGGKRRSTRALHLDEAVGAELRGPFCALRGRLRDGTEVGEEPTPRLGHASAFSADDYSLNRSSSVTSDWTMPECLLRFRP